MKKKILVFSFSAAALLLVLFAVCFIGSGFLIRNDVILRDYSLSKDGTELVLYTDISSSAGYTRGFRDHGGGIKPHYLTFYSAFGGINGTWGATEKHTLPLEDDACEIYFNRADGGYQLVLQKDDKTGEWIRP